METSTFVGTQVGGSVHSLIAAMREELQHYGEMLALLERKHENDISRCFARLGEDATAIRAHGILLHQARTAREIWTCRTARELGRAEDLPLAEVIALLPPDYQPLAIALADENHQLALQVDERARQHQTVLLRSVDLLQQFISSLVPAPGQITKVAA